MPNEMTLRTSVRDPRDGIGDRLVPRVQATAMLPQPISKPMPVDTPTDAAFRRRDAAEVALDGQRGVAASVLSENTRGKDAYTGSNLKPSPQRLIRPEDGDGKCAVHTNVDVSHRQPNSLRRDSPACGEL
jgi:hypothetical protein